MNRFEGLTIEDDDTTLETPQLNLEPPSKKKQKKKAMANLMEPLQQPKLKAKTNQTEPTENLKGDFTEAISKTQKRKTKKKQEKEKEDEMIRRMLVEGVSVWGIIPLNLFYIAMQYVPAYCCQLLARGFIKFSKMKY